MPYPRVVLKMNGAQATQIFAGENTNMDVVRLEKAPKVAVYVPPGFKPWDDAVTLALEYAEIPYAKLWDPEVLRGKLSEYDWLHLHHEDFTGQYGKFFASHRNSPWYIEQQLSYERTAKELGYKKVSDEKKKVAQTIRDYVAGGGFMFAMCAATDSYDITLAAENVVSPKRVRRRSADRMRSKTDLQNFAFQNFTMEMNPLA
jgi:hypothetical protein